MALTGLICSRRDSSRNLPRARLSSATRRRTWELSVILPRQEIHYCRELRVIKCRRLPDNDTFSQREWEVRLASHLDRTLFIYFFTSAKKPHISHLINTLPPQNGEV